MIVLTDPRRKHLDCRIVRTYCWSLRHPTRRSCKPYQSYISYGSSFDCSGDGSSMHQQLQPVSRSYCSYGCITRPSTLEVFHGTRLFDNSTMVEHSFSPLELFLSSPVSSTPPLSLRLTHAFSLCSSQASVLLSSLACMRRSCR